MSDLELAEEIERRLGELEITINKATNFRAFGDQFNERLWPTWQEAQVEEERCRREFRLLTKIIAALRRVPERPPSGEMVMVPRELLQVAYENLCGMTQMLYPQEEESVCPQYISEIGDLLSAAEASKEAK